MVGYVPSRTNHVIRSTVNHHHLVNNTHNATTSSQIWMDFGVGLSDAPGSCIPSRRSSVIYVYVICPEKPTPGRQWPRTDHRVLVHRNTSCCWDVSVGALSDFEHLVDMKIMTLMRDVLFRFHLVPTSHKVSPAFVSNLMICIPPYVFCG